MNVGADYPVEKLSKDFAAVCLATGSRTPRDLKVEGRQLRGIHFALDYLIQANKRVSGQNLAADKLIDAKGKKVVVIGGGDTGADCVGVAHRQGAKCVTQIEILAKPPECRTSEYPWPKYPLLLKTSLSHEEGGVREWSVLTKKFIGENGQVKKLLCAKIPGSEFEIEADLVILALGFLHPKKEGLPEELNLGEKNIFSCGDMRRGQSLVVWAIAEGRQAAYYIDSYLEGESFLPMI
jgi:glutamate synthase (NADPH/NADH) small chain